MRAVNGDVANVFLLQQVWDLWLRESGKSGVRGVALPTMDVIMYNDFAWDPSWFASGGSSVGTTGSISLATAGVHGARLGGSARLYPNGVHSCGGLSSPMPHWCSNVSQPGLVSDR